jgi:hypothetical protein
MTTFHRERNRYYYHSIFQMCVELRAVSHFNPSVIIH